MNKDFEFDKSKEVGDKGEKWFVKTYPKIFKPFTESRDSDLIHIPDGRRVEVKTDTYNMTDTPNFFIERFSDIGKHTPGSFWQVLGKSELFIYLFWPNKKWFWCDNIELGIKVIEAINGLVLVSIPNKPKYGKPYVTSGWPIRREYLINKGVFKDMSEFPGCKKKGNPWFDNIPGW